MILISQFAIFLDRYAFKGFDHKRHKFRPLFLNRFHFWNFGNFIVPGADELILREVLLVKNHVG
jgi:hypothetical protein